MYERIKELAQRNKVIRGCLIAFIAVRVFFRLVIKYCSFFNEDGSINARARELARKNRAARYFGVFLIVIHVFCNHVKRYYIEFRNDRKQRNGNTPVLGSREIWLCRWKIAFGVCIAAATFICCDSVINIHAAIGRRQDENITDIEKENDLESRRKPVQEVSFHYTRGIGKRLFEEGEEPEETEGMQSPDEAVLEDENFRMCIKSPGFDGDIYEGDSEQTYPLVIWNDGDDILTDIRINAELMQLAGYDDKLAEILKRDSEVPENGQVETGTEDGSDRGQVEIGTEDGSDRWQVETETGDGSDRWQVETGSGDGSDRWQVETGSGDGFDIGQTEIEPGNAEKVEWVTELDATVSELENLCFSLMPGEEVAIYLKVPEEYTYGSYKDKIEITAEEFSQSCIIDASIRIYAVEGLPWQTTPDKTQPVINYAPDVHDKNMDLADVFEFHVLESEEYDSGIELVECYLNGDLQKLEPHIESTALRGDIEIATNIKYQVQFKEEGINSLLIRAVDRDGNVSVQNLELQVVKEEDYHVIMPQSIELTVDPAMAYGNTQIYNLRDFALENDSTEDLLVSIEEVLVTVKDGQEKKCSINMAVMEDGKEVKSMPVDEINADNVCDFIISGQDVNGEKHKAYLVFTGMLEDETDDWHDGDLIVKINMKLTEVK